MTLPPVVRLFFAIDLPAVYKERVGEFIHELKKKTKNQSIRFSRPENLHITLQFLPAVSTSDISALITTVQQLIQAEKYNFNISLGKVILFPNPYRPRVIVLDVMPQAELATLSAIVGQGILQAGYAIEDRAYRAHLTIGRIRHPQNINLRLLPLAEPPQLPVLPIEAISLYRSEPHEEGSSYTPLAKIELTN